MSNRSKEKSTQSNLSRRQFGAQLARTLGVVSAGLLADGSIKSSAFAADDKANTKSQDVQMPEGMHMKHDMSGYGIPVGPPQNIAMLVYPQMAALDMVGPNQVLAHIGNVKMHLVWKDKNPFQTDTGMTIQADTTFGECPDDLTVLLIPGGAKGTLDVIKDESILQFLKNKAKTTRYITSVCTGSLVLGAAGLLEGYKATSHWAYRDLLPLFGATTSTQRVTIDRNRITGAGVSAGIDLALQLTELLRNEKAAIAQQLVLEYDPKPLHDAGSPDKAEKSVTNMVLSASAPLWQEFKDFARSGSKFDTSSTKVF